MADRPIKVMVMGGHTKDFHDFAVMGPIYERFLSAEGFDVYITEDRDDFAPDRIAPYDVIVNYTTGENLTKEQSTGLLRGIAGEGKGFVGVHSTADSFKQTPGFINMVGGKFLMHPFYWPKLTFHITDPAHPIMEGLEDFEMEEELYLMETYGHFELLMTTSFEGFERPISWVKPYGLGRVFFTALGHDKLQTENPNFQKMVVNAVRWAKNPSKKPGHEPA